MSSYGTTASSPTSSHAPLHNYWLLAGGYFSLGFAAFQVSAIGWPARAVRYFGGPAELRTEKPIQYGLLCLAIGVIVAIFGLYALSGRRQVPTIATAANGFAFRSGGLPVARFVGDSSDSDRANAP